MFELLYTSLCPKPLCRAELTALLCCVREHNQRTGLTGMLLYQQQTVMQLLEGERDVVLQQFQRLRQDPRHQHIELAYKGPIAARTFAGWSLGFDDPDAAWLNALLPGYLSLASAQVSLLGIRQPSHGVERMTQWAPYLFDWQGGQRENAGSPALGTRCRAQSIACAV
ncbi:BLUF domain-containing protein [Ferrimonas pelagia]|uniref:BLUF domain-containing protein n=1 Tax=Ferrimonas pelagia TaxID=1177826 RepID=A0ABP9EJ51_9GAMM